MASIVVIGGTCSPNGCECPPVRVSPILCFDIVDLQTTPNPHNVRIWQKYRLEGTFPESWLIRDADSAKRLDTREIVEIE